MPGSLQLRGVFAQDGQDAIPFHAFTVPERRASGNVHDGAARRRGQGSAGRETWCRVTVWSVTKPRRW